MHHLPIDPANIPLPPSPEVVPFVLTGTSTPDIASSSHVSTNQATPKAVTGLSLFNTPRNPLPSSPSSALGIHRPKTPSPLPSPIVEPTVFTTQVGTADEVPEVKVEDEDVAEATLEPEVTKAGEGEGNAADPDAKTSDDASNDNQTSKDFTLPTITHSLTVS